jgi:hypothetical protein
MFDEGICSLFRDAVLGNNRRQASLSHSNKREAPGFATR